MVLFSDLVSQLNKRIILYYGASGHGRGLGDGMLSFGVKTPLRREIVTSNFYWSNVSELIDFFHNKGFDTPERKLH